MLMERFELLDPLGRGGFGIAYLAEDKVRCDKVVIKELAPAGLKRELDGMIDLGENGARLRQSFLEEARIISKLDVRGILPVRATFAELGTAYYVTEHLADARTLEQIIRQERMLTVDGALDIFFQILETLEIVHRKGVLHRDIKPSNILVTPKGNAVLIDFGSAREWHGDAELTHTVQFTPGYAPPEQMSERARRGPATDIYSLCATLYHSLTGDPPASASERVSGTRYVPLSECRPDVESSVGLAIDRGLSLAYSERPQTLPEFRTLLSTTEEEVEKPSTLDMLDDQLLRLDRFAFNRRSCPSCNQLLLQPRPLKRGQCPVCTEGMIRRREIHDRRCPSCRAGYLHARQNSWPSLICPCCKENWLSVRRKGILNAESIAQCSRCSAKFEGTGDSLTLVEDATSQFELGSSGTATQWLTRSGRAREIHCCDGCDAQFDLLPDGRLTQVLPQPHLRFRALYPEEWARVSAGLEPGAGNAECDRCAAEYFLENDRLTLLSAHEDPNLFAETFVGRLLSLETARWLGVDKESPRPGFVCEACPTEFDLDGEYLRLVRTKNLRLARFVDQPRTREDWHRIAQALPTISEEESFLASIDDALRASYRAGDIGFDTSNQTLWKGPAERDSQNSTLLITRSEATFGGPFRKWRTPTDAIERAEAEGDYLSLFLTGYRDPVVYRIDPVELIAHMKSGERAIRLEAADLVASLLARRHLVPPPVL
jgi:serine/threonine protein kinase